MVKPETSEAMRYLMRLNAEIGTAKKVDINGYFVGGKTGTAEKVIGGHYSKNRLFTTFMAVSPADKPKYLFLTIMDEPQGLPETGGYATAAYNSGFVTGADHRARRADPRSRAALRAAAYALPAAGETRLWHGQRSRDRRPWPLMRLDALLARNDLDPALAGLDVAGLSADSRAIGEGFAFFAIPGHAGDGLSYVNDAKARGAVVVVAQRAADCALPLIVVPDVRAAIAQAAARFYPRQPQTIVAVTGTSGKTSVVAFLRQIWAAMGHEAASLGTVGVVDSKGAHYGALTTPGPVELHRILDELAGRGVTHLAMEASSLGIDQRRLDGVRLTAAGFTNFSRDHLDHHRDMEEYFAAKMRLFDTLMQPGQTAVIDADSDVADACDERLLGARTRDLHRRRKRRSDRNKGGAAQRAGDQPSAWLQGRGVFCRASARRRLPDLQRAGRGGSRHCFRRRSPGRLRRPRIISRARPDGSNSSAPATARRFSSITPTSPTRSKRCFATLRPLTKGRLIVVFGCGGDRDKGKRPLMGEIAARGADLVIITDDNPRSEQPAAIRAEIMAGARNAGGGAEIIEIARSRRGDRPRGRRASRGRCARRRRKGA